MRVELATKAAKTPVQDKIREIIVGSVIPLLLENRAEFYPGNGDNLTLGQDTAYYNLIEDDGTPAGRVMFSWSPNLWGPKDKSASNGKGKSQPVDENVSLLPAEVAALDAAIATMKQANDFDNAVKLMTIKSVASKQGGKVSREDYRVVFSLMPTTA